MRQYKKDIDDHKKKLTKLEEEYAFEKNKEMLIGAQLDVLYSLLRKKNQLRIDKNY